MFEVLMFLFENYMDSNTALSVDAATIILELEKIGFDRYEIDRAFHWIQGLNDCQTAVKASILNPLSIRYYLLEERERLGTEGMGFLLYLEQLKIIDPVTREVVIDRIMALENFEVSIGRIRWVVLMALFNQPEKKAALSLLQDMILADAFDVLH